MEKWAEDVLPMNNSPMFLLELSIEFMKFGMMMMTSTQYSLG